jgi:hypothetical protein
MSGSKMLHNWTTEQTTAIITYITGTYLSINNITLSFIQLGDTIIESVVKGLINLLFALILFIITHYLKGWLPKFFSKRKNKNV